MTRLDVLLVCSLLVVVCCEGLELRLQRLRNVRNGNSCGSFGVQFDGETLSNTSRRRMAISEAFVASQFNELRVDVVPGTGAVGCGALDPAQKLKMDYRIFNGVREDNRPWTVIGSVSPMLGAQTFLAQFQNLTLGERYEIRIKQRKARNKMEGENVWLVTRVEIVTEMRSSSPAPSETGSSTNSFSPSVRISQSVTGSSSISNNNQVSKTSTSSGSRSSTKSNNNQVSATSTPSGSPSGTKSNNNQVSTTSTPSRSTSGTKSNNNQVSTTSTRSGSASGTRQASVSGTGSKSVSTAISSSTSRSASISPSKLPSTLQGCITYRAPSFSCASGLNFNTIQTLPVRFTKVRLSGTNTQNVLTNTTSNTDNAGCFSFSGLSYVGNINVFVQSISVVTAQSTSSCSSVSWNFQVNDYSGVVKEVLLGTAQLGQTFNGALTLTNSATAITADTSSEFAILDNLIKAAELLCSSYSSTITFSQSLQVSWSTASVETGYYNGKMRLQGVDGSNTDQFDLPIIYALFMEYAQDTLFRSDNFIFSSTASNINVDGIDACGAFTKGWTVAWVERNYGCHIDTSGTLGKTVAPVLATRTTNFGLHQTFTAYELTRKLHNALTDIFTILNSMASSPALTNTLSFVQQYLALYSPYANETTLLSQHNFASVTSTDLFDSTNIVGNNLVTSGTLYNAATRPAAFWAVYRVLPYSFSTSDPWLGSGRSRYGLSKAFHGVGNGLTRTVTLSGWCVSTGTGILEVISNNVVYRVSQPSSLTVSFPSVNGLEFVVRLYLNPAAISAQNCGTGTLTLT